MKQKKTTLQLCHISNFQLYTNNIQNSQKPVISLYKALGRENRRGERDWTQHEPTAPRLMKTTSISAVKVYQKTFSAVTISGWTASWCSVSTAAYHVIETRRSWPSPCAHWTLLWKTLSGSEWRDTNDFSSCTMIYMCCLSIVQIKKVSVCHKTN